MRIPVFIKFLVAFSGIAAIAVVMAYAVVQWSLRKDLEIISHERLERSTLTAEKLINNYVDTVELRLDGHTHDPRFKAVVETQHVETIEHFMLEEFENLDAVYVSVQWRDPLTVVDHGDARLATLAGMHPQSRIVLFEGELVLVVTRAIEGTNDNTLGMFTRIEQLDSWLIQYWSDLSGVEITWGEEPVPERALTMPLPGVDGVHVYMLATDEQLALDRARVRLLGGSGAVLLVVLLASLLYARSLTGDIRAIHDATRRIGEGEFEARTTVQRKDEIGDVAIAVDEMAARLAENQLQLMQAAKMASVGRLAGGVAHDFNNVLAVILSYASLARDDKSIQDALKQDLSEIIRAADRGAVLTHQLLAFSRKQILRPEIIDLNSIVAEIQQMLRRLLGSRFALNSRTEAHLGHVRADPGQIQQVLMNLIVNARDAMADGGVVTIETANVVMDAEACRPLPGMRPGTYVMLAVSDAGEGMDASTLAQIFEPFFTTKGEGEGTGLGLATVHGIVHQSGGFIAVQSAPGDGSTFRVYLPRVELELVAHKPVVHAVQSFRGTETVLLAEDDESLRQITATILEQAGYEVVLATNGRDALNLFLEERSPPVGVILTDVMMPQISGLELVREVRQTNRNLPVVFISGYPGSEELEQEMRVLGGLFLKKPYTPWDLQRILRQALDEDVDDPDTE